jgi:hypothetical protein
VRHFTFEIPTLSLPTQWQFLRWLTNCKAHVHQHIVKVIE